MQSIYNRSIKGMNKSEGWALETPWQVVQRPPTVPMSVQSICSGSIKGADKS